MDAPAAIAIRIEVRDGEYHHQCGWTMLGVDWRPVGCDHPSPRAACDHADRLEGRARSLPAWADEPL